jgi:hypothetical protein
LFLVIIAIAGTLSGCTFLSKPSPTPTVPAGTPVPTELPAGKMSVVQSGDTITITGGAGENVRSDTNITLSKADAYLINVTYGGIPTSLCLISLGDEAVPNTVEDWGGKAEVFYPKASFNNGQYPVIVKEAHGPWTMVIQKNPKAEPIVAGPKVNASAGFHISQYVHLNKGKATFKFTRNTLIEHYAGGIHLVLFNVDKGVQEDYLWWNMGDASHEYTIDISAAGNYTVGGSCMSDWEATISQ